MAVTDVFRPEWLAFEKELGFRPLLHGPTYDDLTAQDNAIGVALVKKYPFLLEVKPAADVKLSEHQTSGIRLKSYVPSDLKPNSPLVLYIHGGGWALGSVDLDDRFVCQHAKDTGLVFVSVEYRLAPKHKWPAAPEDCSSAFDWCVANAESLGAKPDKVVVMGKSAGGQLALGTALKAIDDGKGAQLQGVVAGVPVTCHPDAVPSELKDRYTSYDENAENTVNTKTGMMAFLDLFGAPSSDPYVSCLLHPRIKDLPRVYMNVSGADTLRDDGRLFKEQLDNHNVDNRYDEYDKLPHYFFAFPSPHLDKLREEYFAKTAKGILFAAGY